MLRVVEGRGGGARGGERKEGGGFEKRGGLEKVGGAMEKRDGGVGESWWGYGEKKVAFGELSSTHTHTPAQAAKPKS